MSTEFLSVEQARKSRGWLIIDADGQTVGRLASQIASILRGKHKPTYTPHTDGGDCVVVINVDKIKFTGNKLQDKRYFWHTSYIGGLKETTAGKLLEKNPDRVLRIAVAGMLPKGNLGKKLIRKLKIYSGAEHPHGAQSPKVHAVRYT